MRVRACVRVSNRNFIIRLLPFTFSTVTTVVALKALKHLDIVFNLLLLVQRTPGHILPFSVVFPFAAAKHVSLDTTTSHCYSSYSSSKVV